MVVTLIACTVWLFAEAESLSDVDIPTQVSLSAANPALRIETGEGWENRVRVTLRGSNTGISQARELLEGGVRLPLPIAGSPTDATSEVDLLSAMQNMPELRQFGVVVVAVVPARVSIRVREMISVTVPIRAMLPGVELDGSPRVSPSELSLRVPRSLRDSLAEAGQWPPVVSATVPEATLSALPRGALVEREADLVFPESLSAATGAEVPASASATINFSIRARSETLEQRAPVQVLLPPIESGEWDVDLAGGDVLLDVVATGPPEAISRLRDRTDRLVAVLALSSDDLATGATSKGVGFALLRDGAFAPVPDGLRIETPRRTVTFTVRRLRDADEPIPEEE